jgi:hypothetical protein
VLFVEAAILLFCWLLTFKMFPDIVKLIFLSLVIALWCTLIYDAVCRNALKEVFE